MRSYTFNVVSDARLGKISPDYVKNWERFDVPHGATLIYSYNGKETDINSPFEGVLRPDTPQSVVIDGAAHLNFYTYNFRTTSGGFLGAEIRTKAYFNPPKLNHYIDFTATVGFRGPGGLKGQPRRRPKLGLVCGFYLYSADKIKKNNQLVVQPQGDEIDVELLGRSEYNGRYVGPPLGLWLNTFNNEGGSATNRISLQRGAVYPATSIASIDLQERWNTYTIRWFRDRAGFGVKWFVHQISGSGSGASSMILVRTEPTGRYKQQTREAMPDQPLKVHFNIWAPGPSYFPEAYSSSLKTSPNPISVPAYTFDILNVSVKRDDE